MRSVADELRREQAAEMRALSPAQRVARAKSLFETGIRVFMAGQNVSRDEAIDRIRRSRQNGRRASGCMTR